MEHYLFVLLLFSGITPLAGSVYRKYSLIKTGYSWTSAQSYCKSNYVDLAIIKNTDDMVQLQKEAQKQQFSSSAWIGLYNDIWRWSLGSESLGSITRWSSGQPYNSDQYDSCAVIYSSGWLERRCTYYYPFVCFDETRTGSDRYIYVTTTKTWHAAQSYCRQYYTDLSGTRDSLEYSYVRGKTGTNYAWIGLFTLADSWKWADQTMFSTMSWMSGQPDNARRGENCGYVNNSVAADARCLDSKPFFCYKMLSAQQQIIKMKLKSDKDVNDPAVKSTIMEQFMQKLKDHGFVKDFRVKWKVHPDGNVFQKEKENSTTALNKL